MGKHKDIIVEAQELGFAANEDGELYKTYDYTPHRRAVIRVHRDGSMGWEITVTGNVNDLSVFDAIFKSMDGVMS